MDSLQHDSAEPDAARLSISPPDAAIRRIEHWNGLSAEAFDFGRLEPYGYGVTPERHLLIITERCLRRDGESRIEGLAPSRRRDYSHTICFVPAGCRIEGWQVPAVRSKIMYIYMEPDWRLLDPEMQVDRTALVPQLQLGAPDIERTALKLKPLIGQTTPGARLYAEAVGVVLQRELLRLVSAGDSRHRPKGGLTPWQEKRVRDYLEENLASHVTLMSLAAVAGLSASHFAHAFKHSFGVPPHRYFALRRLERAKALLAAPGVSVTEIALTLGFSETSAFTSAFRKTTGLTPSEYRRENH